MAAAQQDGAVAFAGDGACAHARVVLDGVISAAACDRLAWLVAALAHPGHSPHTEVVTTYELAHCDPRLLPLLVRARPWVAWQPGFTPTRKRWAPSRAPAAPAAFTQHILKQKP